MQILIPIEKDKLWGFSNLKGEIIIEPKFIEVEPFNKGVALVCAKKVPAKELYVSKYEYDIFPNETVENYKGDWDKIWGIINQKGEFVIEPIFKSIGLVSNGIVIGIKYAGPGKRYSDYCENIYHLMSFKNHKFLIGTGERFNSYSQFSNKFWFLSYGRDPVRKYYCNTHHLILNENGVNILKFSGKNTIGDFENGIIKITKHNNTKFYNEKGVFITEKKLGFENISKNLNGFYFYKEEDRYFNFDISQNLTTELDYCVDLTSSEFKSKIIKETVDSY